MIVRSHSNMISKRTGRRLAFTITELLIVMAIIILLISILLVAVNQATARARSADTLALMNTVKQGLTLFQNDTGYLPPVLDNDRNMLYPFDVTDPTFDPADVQEWHSITSLAEYLVGYGDHSEDGYGAMPNQWETETPPVGIRHPQADGVWGATLYGNAEGLLDDRMELSALPGLPPRQVDEGPVLGPYISLSDDNVLGSTDGTINPQTDMLNVYEPGSNGYSDDDPKVLLDGWNRPLRYYRAGYPIGSLKSRMFGVDNNGDGIIDADPPTLADVILIRPFKVKDLGTSAMGDQVADIYADANGDTASSFGLRASEFAILSSGADKSFDETIRAADVNADNIVVSGP